ncbi:MAG TPA: hypothetical protein VI137_11610 [Pseudolabrys sp.]
MSKRSKKGAKAAKAAKAKAPALAELEQEESYCRSNLQATADEAYAYGLELPAIDAPEEDADSGIFDVEEAAQHGVNLTCDAEDWLKAYRALREARVVAESRRIAAECRKTFRVLDE